MGKPAARISDMHVCPMVTGMVPHVGGPVAMGSPTVFTGSLPQARVGDMLVCVGPPDVIAMGSSGVFVNDMPAARLGDQTAHGGAIVAGLPTVLIGETGGAGGGGGGDGGGGAGSSNDAYTGGQVALAFADAMSQAEALIAAAQSGAPFCQICFGANGVRRGVENYLDSESNILGIAGGALTEANAYLESASALDLASLDASDVAALSDVGSGLESANDLILVAQEAVEIPSALVSPTAAGFAKQGNRAIGTFYSAGAGTIVGLGTTGLAAAAVAVLVPTAPAWVPVVAALAVGAVAAAGTAMLASYIYNKAIAPAETADLREIGAWLGKK